MIDKEIVLEALELVLEDLDMLEDGRWDEITHDSVQATRENVELAIGFIKKFDNI